MSTSRYRERHSTSGAKSDPGDAFVLAELARTDSHNHRPVAGDSELGEAIKVLARAHQSMIWTRQRQLNQLRSTLREFYPGALEAFDELGSSDALAVLAVAPTPALGRSLSRSKIASALRRGGRQRRVDERAIEIQTALRSAQLEAPPIVANAMGATVTALVAVAAELIRQIARLETDLAEHFEQHPDAKIIRSLPGLGMILGARVLAEFGDDPNRYATPSVARTTPARHPSPAPRANTASCSPATPATNASPTPATCGPSARLTASPGARTFYDQHRAAGDTHHRALRALANRLVGILHGCLHSPHASTTNTPPGHTAPNSPLDTNHPWRSAVGF